VSTAVVAVRHLGRRDSAGRVRVPPEAGAVRVVNSTAAVTEMANAAIAKPTARERDDR
jgi:hypothetical protein